MVKINIYLYHKDQQNLFNGKSNNEINLYINSQKIKKKKYQLTERDRDNFIMKSLNAAPCNDYTLICIDRMVSTCCSDQILKCVDYTIETIPFDIFYLAGWADRCDLYSDFYDFENYKIVKTLSPHGMACLLFSPHGRKKFLEKIELTPNRSLDLIVNPQLGKFKVYTTTPSIVNFDITQSECDLELVKVCKCREVPSAVRPIEVVRRNTSTLNLLWFILVLIIIFCVAAILLSLVERNGKIKNTPMNLGPLSYLSTLNPVYPYDPTGIVLKS